MENKNSQQTETNATKITFVQPKSVRVKNDYLVIRMEDGKVIRKHVNYFKQILGVPFTPVTPKKESQSEEIVAATQAQVG